MSMGMMIHRRKKAGEGRRPSPVGNAKKADTSKNLVNGGGGNGKHNKK